jgi:hypothetical protein
MMARKNYQHPFHEEVHGEFSWCLHCERVSRTEEWVNNDWYCPYSDCDGSALDVSLWDCDHWPRSQHSEYPEIPELGKYYPLYSG